MHRRLAHAALPVLLTLAVTACAPAEDDDAAADGSAGTGDTASCDVADLPLLSDGTLTIGTDSPAYEPWFADNDPTNGKGFESAVAYAVADRLGFAADDVTWVTVPFNNSYAPGEKKFDFDINQVSISPERAQAVDFSRGYYTASQAVIALDDSPVSDAASVADLADYKLGAQTGTTSLTAIRDVIQPGEDPLVFEDTNAAKQALLNDQVDGIVADLPTALYITAAEIPKAKIVGQFQVAEDQTEQFGLLFEKGSGLVPCVDEALDALEDDGTLAELEQQWIPAATAVPELP
ncbi:ABC transporter substrate-binding protein [Nocardioides sp. 1609]|uniref:ABC transporter substrate-binding protein n=1 Tax=Nocardioides sp. 1609 TaxID=2508327 RepID=UPI00106F3B01|nr:ABC transporter substrate-binding protein [Nocardioides sp. 1609]